MNPSRYKDHIGIQPRTVVTEDMGVSEAWTPEVDCSKRWGRFIPLSSYQRIQWQQANAQASHRVVFRTIGNADLEAYTMGQVRFFCGGKTYSLVSTAKRLGGKEDAFEFIVIDSDEGMSDPTPVDVGS